MDKPQPNHPDQDSVSRLRELVTEVSICMFVTAGQDGSLPVRPMTTASVEPDGSIWFFSNKASNKVYHLEENSRVHLLYAHPGKETYVSVTGTCHIICDREKEDQLWNPEVMSWFPAGTQDPGVCLLKVEVSEARYWSAGSNTMETFLHLLKTIATGEKYDGGESGTIRLANP